MKNRMYIILVKFISNLYSRQFLDCVGKHYSYFEEKYPRIEKLVKFSSDVLDTKSVMFWCDCVLYQYKGEISGRY